MKSKYLIRIFIMILLALPLINASDSPYETVKVGDCIDLIQTCSDCTYNNITSVIVKPYGGNSIKLLNETAMTKDGTLYYYNFCIPMLGTYNIDGHGNEYGIDTPWGYSFEARNNSMWFIIFLYALAIIFLVCTLFVDEEFFVYISGVLFLIGGVYIMINGFDVLSDFYSRALSYVSLGLGFLFTIGAYTFNKFSLRGGEEIEED